MRFSFLALSFSAGLLCWSPAAPAQEAKALPDAALKALQDELAALRQELQQRDQRLLQLEARMSQFGGDRLAVPPLASPTGSLSEISSQVSNERALTLGGGSAHLVDVSFDILTVGGGSTANQEELAILQGGGHDPKARGFTLQQAELSLAGAVDPYFNAEAHIVFTNEVVELEEAYALTTSLPYGLQVKAGYFLTEFGKLNPTHPHAWAWTDQPVINSRLFGGDGMRGTGLRLSWLTPLDWNSEFLWSVQQPTGETMPSFLGEGLAHEHGDEGDGEEHAETIGGRPLVEREVRSLRDLVWLQRWVNGGDLSETVSGQFGLSMLYGPNNSGKSGDTLIYGADLTLKWRPTKHQRGWPFVTWQSEIMQRKYKANGFFDEEDPADPSDDVALPATTLKDWGFYSQVLYGFHPGWSAGLRYEYASGSGDSVHEEAPVARGTDGLRDDRTRLAPVLIWQPTEFSRLRLQYNYDRADHLDDPAHSLWLGMEILFGSHPAHGY